MNFFRLKLVTRNLFQQLDRFLLQTLEGLPPFAHQHPSLAVATAHQPHAAEQSIANGDPLKDFFGIVWNTQKRRRSVEKRATRRYFSLEYGTMKIKRPKRNIRADHETGEFFEIGRLAPNKYKTIMEETEEIQKKMANAFMNEPKDKEVLVVYENEKEKHGNVDKFKLVEIEKERPAYFSANLVQKARALNPDETAMVKPSGLA